MAETKRRARGEDSIYNERSRNRWAGTITVGWKPDGRRDRIIVRGRTKTEVKDKLRAKHQELAAGVRTPAHYTVPQCLKDWLEQIADAVGRSTTRTTGVVYRRQLRPVTRTAAAALGRCSRAEERATEAKTEPLGYQLGCQDHDQYQRQAYEQRK